MFYYEMNETKHNISYENFKLRNLLADEKL